MEPFKSRGIDRVDFFLFDESYGVEDNVWTNSDLSVILT
jgi:hypothetical protein